MSPEQVDSLLTDVAVIPWLLLFIFFALLVILVVGSHRRSDGR